MFNQNFFTDQWSKALFPWMNQFDPFGKLKETTDVYKNFFEFYNNFNKSFFNPPVPYNLDKFQEMIKDYQKKYTDIIFNLMGLNTKTSLKEIFEQFTKSYNLIFPDSTYLQPIKNWIDLIEKENEKIFEQILNNEEIEKFLKSPPLGLTREFVELVKKVMKSFIDYLKKLHNFRKTFQKISEESFEKFIETLKEEYKKGEKFDSFDKLFKRWIDVNEEIFIKYFKSKEYCEALGEYIKGVSNLKKSIDEYVYVILKDTNIATKTELDRAYKEIYELKKELRALKKILKEESK